MRAPILLGQETGSHRAKLPVVTTPGRNYRIGKGNTESVGGGKRWRPATEETMTVHDRAYELARALQTGDEYQQYRKAYDGLDDTARQMLKDWRLMEAQVQMAQMTGEELEEEVGKKRERLQELIGLHQPILEFLQAEQRLMVIINDVQRILAENIELWDYDLKAE